MSHSNTATTKEMAIEASRGFWVIFGFSFMVFFVIACFGQLLGWHWRTWLPGAEGVKSIFGGVKAAVYTFMSHLT